MGDTTSIYPSINSDEGSLDAFWVGTVAWVMLYLVGLLLFGAAPPFDFGEIAVAVVFGFMGVVGIAIPLVTQAKFGNIFTSATTKYQSAAVYIFFTALVLWLLSGSVLGGAGGELNALSTASQSDFYASFTGNLEVYNKAAIVVNVAPIIETIIAFSGTYLIVGFMLEAGLKEKDPLGGFGVAAVGAMPAAVGFGLLHDSEAARLTIEFFIRAFLVMFASMFVIFGEEVTDRDYFPFPAVMAFAFSVHRALNLYEYGGYQAYYSDLMTAQMPHLTLSYWWLLFDVVWVLILGWGIGKATARVIDPSFELKPVERLKRQFNLRQ